MCQCCGGSEKELILNVEGMSCGHCKMAVEKAVSALEGVSSVQVDLTAKKVAIIYNPDKVSEEAIKESITDQGYDVL